MPFGGGAIEAGKAFIKFLVDDSEVNGKLASIGKKLSGFGKRGLAATAPILGAFAGAAAVFTKVGSELADLSARTGLSAEALSELKFAADQTGTSLQSVEGAVKKMQAGLFAAGRGEGSLLPVLQELGLSVEELQRLKPEDQFTRIADAIGKVEDPSTRAALAQRAFGRAGTALLPMLDQTSGGLAALRQRARDLGVTMSGEAAQAADQLGDQFDAVKAQFGALVFQIGASIAGPLTDFLVWAQDSLKWMIDFVREHPDLVAAIGAIAFAIGGASFALLTFGTLMAVIAAHPIITFLSLLAGLVLGIATYFGLASKASTEFDKNLSRFKSSVGLTGRGPEQTGSDAARVQAQLQSAMRNPQGVDPGTQAAAHRTVSNSQAADLARIAANTAAALPILERIAKKGPLIAGRN